MLNAWERILNAATKDVDFTMSHQNTAGPNQLRLQLRLQLRPQLRPQLRRQLKPQLRLQLKAMFPFSQQPKRQHQSILQKHLRKKEVIKRRVTKTKKKKNLGTDVTLGMILTGTTARTQQ